MISIPFDPITPSSVEDFPKGSLRSKPGMTVPTGTSMDSIGIYSPFPAFLAPVRLVV
jgi:hypothetical protein